MSLVNLGDEQDARVDAPLDMTSAEINMQIATAKRYPRSLTRFRTALIAQATMTEKIAGACVYAMPRAGKKIEGPSVRLAEMILAAYGNCRAGARIVAELDNFVVAQGVFLDLEHNAAVTMEVSRRIVDKNGRRFDVDMIGVTGAAACSIALRNAIFRAVPRALWWDAYLAACSTITGGRTTLADKRKAALEAFRPFGVTEQQIYAALEVAGPQDIGPEQLVTLAGFLTAINEEQRDPEELFPRAETKASRAPPPEVKKITETPQKAAKAGEGAGLPRGATGAVGAAPPASSPSVLVSGIANALIDARTAKDVEAVSALFIDEIAAASAGDQEAAAALFDGARAAIKARTEE